MKLFFYILVSVLILGGCYYLVVHRPAPSDPAVAAWEEEAQKHLTTLLADGMKAVQSNDWTTFDADLKKADDHLAAAPVGANTHNFEAALKGYHAQQEMRAQLAQ